MKLNGNTILITGGGSGIGLALALEFKRRGNEVLVAGRSEGKLADARAKGLHTSTADMNDEGSVRALATQGLARFPALNMVIHNAGIMVNEKLTSGDASKIARDTLLTNVLGPMILTNALLPHFLKLESAVIMTVTSGLAYVPLAMTPSYSASKAAIHSYTLALRYQLKETAVEVKELVPPYVRTGLMGARQAEDPNAMPLADFVAEVFQILEENPAADEITVGRALPQRRAGDQGPTAYQEFFKAQNDRLMTARREEWEAL